MFAQASVIPSVPGGGGGWLPACITGHMARRSASGGSADRRISWVEPSPRELQDMVNKQAVRNLLKCILVNIVSTLN